MPWMSRSITAAGLILLAHACYSAKEHAALYSGVTSTSQANQLATGSLPLDIRIETIVATLVVCIGLVLGSPTLRPVQWHVWAGKIERDGAAGFTDGAGEVDKDYRGNPYQFLEARQGFVDIRRQRQEFAAWAKGDKN